MKQANPNDAFLVRFDRDTDVARRQVSGRIEHVASWQSRRFESVDELIGFVASVLSEVWHSQEADTIPRMPSEGSEQP